jgi:hypothetical protein
MKGIKMKRFLLVSVLLLLATAVLTPSAHAQISGDPANNVVCPADMTASQCYAAGYGGGTGGSGGSGGGSTGCGTVNSLQSCISACACQYNKNVKSKCGKGAAVYCKDIYLSEQHACEGHCITDW